MQVAMPEFSTAFHGCDGDVQVKGLAGDEAYKAYQRGEICWAAGWSGDTSS